MNQLIEKLKESGFSDSRNLLTEYFKNHNSDWFQYITINPFHYHRKQIFSNSDFEIILITWNVNQQSLIHDHADNGCYMLLLQGNLQEEIYKENKIIKTSTLTPSNISYIDNSIGFHKILNPSSSEIAVSLHIYSPPNHIAKLLM